MACSRLECYRASTEPGTANDRAIAAGPYASASDEPVAGEPPAGTPVVKLASPGPIPTPFNGVYPSPVPQPSAWTWQSEGSASTPGGSSISFLDSFDWLCREMRAVSPGVGDVYGDLEVLVDGEPVTGAPVNKGATFQTRADRSAGRTRPFWGGAGWRTFLSPDLFQPPFATAGGFEVVTDPGQAYRYIWDVSRQRNRDKSRMAIEVRNPAKAPEVRVRLFVPVNP